MLPWAPDPALEIGSSFLILGLLIVAYMALRIPESLLITQVQIQRAIKLYKTVLRMKNKEEINEFGLETLVTYLQNIPSSRIEEE